MGFSFQQSATHEDVPLFVAKNTVELTSTVHRWTQTGSKLDTDETEALFPVTRAFDRFNHLLTQPDPDFVGSSNTWYLLFRADNLIKADTLFIGGHNLGTTAGSGGVNTSVEISDDGQGVWTLIHNFGTITDNKRLFAEMTNIFSGIEHLRIKFTTVGVGGGNFIPQVGEFFAGPKKVLDHQPNIPWDEASLRSEIARFKSKSGIITTHTFNAGGRFGTMTLQPSTAEEITLIRDIFKDTNFGSKPLILVDKPNTDPLAYWIVLGNELNMPLQGPNDRLVDLDFEEMAPFVSGE